MTHENLKAAYEEDAKRTEKPYLLWQVRVDGVWETLIVILFGCLATATGATHTPTAYYLTSPTHTLSGSIGS